MLTVHNISKSYNLNPILKDITFSVNAGERIGLIGPNGSGKSTLLRIIVGEERPSGGHVTFTPATVRVSYLAQGFAANPSLTLDELLHQTIGNPNALEAELIQLGLALATAPDRPDLLDAYDHTLSRLNRYNASQVNSALTAFALDQIPATQPIGALSGGQKTRLAMALTLLNDPHVLLLDEPTNHLDIAMLEWLEAWLCTFAGGVLLVSHDRAFLDHTATHILDLDPHTHTLRAYTGNYSDYLDQYLSARDKQWSAYKDQVYAIRRMKQDIARTREQADSVERSTTPRNPGVRAIAKKVMKKAKSREKKLERYLESEERTEKPARSWQMKLDFTETHLGRDVLTLENLTVGYPHHPPLLHDLGQHIRVGQRVILTGPNGCGKTTLLRTIAGRLPPVGGAGTPGRQRENGLHVTGTGTARPDLERAGQHPPGRAAEPDRRPLFPALFPL